MGGDEDVPRLDSGKRGSQVSTIRAFTRWRITSGLGSALALLAVAALEVGCSSVSDTMRNLGASHSDLKSQILMARLMERQNQHAKALETYEDLLRKHPRSAELHHRLALVDHRVGRKEDAERHFRKAVELSPKDATLLNDYGYWLYLENRFPEAEAQLTSAIRNDPSNKMIANNLAMALGRQGKVDQAERIFQRTTSPAEAQANLGYLQAQLRQFDKARAHYARAIELDPQNKVAVDALAQLGERDGEVRAASSLVNSSTGEFSPPAPAQGESPVGGPEGRVPGAGETSPR